MSITVVEEKIKLLPEAYLDLLNNYVDELLEKSQKIQSLKGSLSKNANVEIIEKEKDAWSAVAKEKYING
ncbi:MAG: hypothetical protein J6K22_01460 [Spirochaetaceae bacterium]|nr:hypothetical protein [Spirochaetaceae bacterium]